ncbi:NAD(P)-binding protein [Mollisia scopiformis]|uniref:NAD(P)-binding protein n=1 Tax=Mollisia scopiformis TaxID=149040 RepID=A0A132B2V5_MOLSC|nr:NAD(P)-binding protein [Mollisia scopiformis]KUJ06738.1 NAD(P)-binding protein [Mollisia scopiformis]
MSKKLTVFVTGATGGQGGAVAKYLLTSGHAVHALVRDPSKPASQALEKAGAKLFKGDFDDINALAATAQSCNALFLMVSPTYPDQLLELTHAQNVITAALSTSPPITHCVVSTATGAESHLSFASFDPNFAWLAIYWSNKKKIQDLVMQNFQKWTVLQPAWLMSNWLSPVAAFTWGEELKTDKVLLNAFGKGTKIELCAADTVGRFAVPALEGRGDMQGKIIKLAGESLDMDEIARVVSEVGGVEVKVRYRSEEEVERLKGVSPIVATQVWQRVDGSGADVEEVRKWGIEMMGFKEYLGEHRDSLRAALGLE